MLDDASGLLVSPYVIERGERLEIDPMPVFGFRKHILETREPLTISEDWIAEAERYGNPPVLAGEVPKSGLFVPLFAGGRATGVISLQNVDREFAFSDADERLLVTLAGSLSVALENARLVHETRQRNAELALINRVQQAIAGELEPQAIYDIVGDKIQEVFDAQVVDIAVYDEPSGLLHFPYVFERGERLGDEPIGMTPFRQFVLDREEPLLVNENLRAFAEEHGVQTIGEAAASALWVPVALGSSGRGWISLQNLDREHAFSDSDVQLLSTLAGSLGVALENARLLHETRQRNAELALINSVQAAIAGELDPQAIYDIVGDKIQEVFDAQVVDIGLYDEASGLIHFPYTIERGVRTEEDAGAVPLTRFRTHVLESRAPIVVNENMAAFSDELGPGDDRRGVALGSVGAARRRRRRPGLDLAPELRSGARVQRLRRAAPQHAFREPRRRARQRAPRPRDPPAQRRACPDQQRARRARRRARAPGDLRRRRRQDPGGLRRPDRRHRRPRRGRRPRPLPLRRSSAGNERTIHRCRSAASARPCSSSRSRCSSGT